MEEHDGTGPEMDAAADPSSEETDAQLGQLLSDRFGEDFNVDDLQTYTKDRSTWNAQQNRHNMEAAQARKDAEATRDQLLTAVATQGHAQTANQQAGQALSENDFFNTLGIRDPDEQLSGRQAYAMFKGMSDYAQAANKVYGEKFHSMEGKNAEFDSKFQQTTEAFAQYLTDMKVEEVLQDFPHADREVIVRAIREAPQGEMFDQHVKDAARTSDERIRSLASEAQKAETERRRSARANRFTGSGIAGAAAGKKMPSLNTSEGIKAFIDAHPPGLGDEPI